MLAGLWQRRGPVDPAAAAGYSDPGGPVHLASGEEQVGGGRGGEAPAREGTAMTDPGESSSALEALREERDRLAGRLQRLEQMLADPEKGQNAILYYRLRGIWSACHQDLVVLARQFRQKYEGESGSAQREAAEADRLALANRLRSASAEEKRLRGEVQRLSRELHERQKPFKVGEKQTVTRALADAERQLAAVTKRVAALRHEAAVTPPSTPRAALSVSTRRAINTLLIALAQHYYLLYRDEQVAEMALRAARKPVEDVYFGLANDCLALSRKARELTARSRMEENRQDAVRRRAQYLHGRLRYADDASAIPVQKSAKELPTRIASGDEVFSNFGEMLEVNVLAHDYWDLSRALLP